MIRNGDLIAADTEQWKAKRKTDPRAEPVYKLCVAAAGQDPKEIAQFVNKVSAAWAAGDILYAQLVVGRTPDEFGKIIRLIRSQEVAIRFWQSAPEFRKVSSLKAWIYKVAYNLFATHCRDRRLECAELDENITAASHSDSPEKLLDQRLLKEELQSALNQLPENQRLKEELKKLHGILQKI